MYKDEMNLSSPMFIIYSFDSCNQKLVESETPEIGVIMVRLVPLCCVLLAIC